MALNNRFLPSHAPGQSNLYGMDFSNVLPPGVGIASGSLAAFRNSVPPTPTTDLTLGPVEVNGRRLYAQVSGGISATDYRLVWSATDSLGYVWPRATLLLCSQTS